jgi:hypothetical protein
VLLRRLCVEEAEDAEADDRRRACEVCDGGCGCGCGSGSGRPGAAATIGRLGIVAMAQQCPHIRGRDRHCDSAT